MVYGQTEVTKDLFDARCGAGQPFFFNVEDVVPTDLKSDTPRVHFKQDGVDHVIHCDYFAQSYSCGGIEDL